MPFGEALKHLRKDNYGAKEEGPKPESGGPRIIKLTDDEAKALSQGGEGQEVTCTVTGRVSGSELSVSSVTGESTMPDQNQMASEVMGKMGQAPVMRPQTMPSPS